MQKIAVIIIIALVGVLSFLLGRSLSAPSDQTITDSTTADCAQDARDGVTRYMCGMHTHIHSKTEGKCPVCGMKLMPSLDEGSAFNPDLISVSANDPVIDYIKTIKIGTSGGNSGGKLYNAEFGYDESAIFLQMAHVPGTLESFLVTHPGQYVQKGQKIGSVYSKEFIAVLEALEFNKKSDAVMRASMNNLKEWKISPATLKQFDMNADYRKPVDIYADRSGVVTMVHARAGSHAGSHGGTTMPLYEINESGSGWMKVLYLPSERFPFAVGSTVHLNIGNSQTFKITGRVLNANLPSHTHHGKNEAIIEVRNPNKKLLIGAAYDCYISGSEQEQNIWIPASSILWSGKEAIVYVRDTSFLKPVYQIRNVELGTYAHESYQVLNGLSEGEEIVVNGAFKLDASARISGKYHRGFMEPQTKSAVLLKK